MDDRPFDWARRQLTMTRPPSLFSLLRVGRGVLLKEREDILHRYCHIIDRLRPAHSAFSLPNRPKVLWWPKEVSGKRIANENTYLRIIFMRSPTRNSKSPLFLVGWILLDNGLFAALCNRRLRVVSCPSTPASNMASEWPVTKRNSRPATLLERPG